MANLDRKLSFVSVFDLLKESFYIPGYQRGYRWQPEQVIALLEDIWEFRQSNDVPEKKYCLQPLVVSKRADGSWEVIDGQQRLTTIFLILNYLGIKGIYQIAYETPYAKDEYVLDCSKFTPDQNIDSYHMNQAMRAIEFWFQNKFQDEDIRNDEKDDLKRDLSHYKKYRVQFIWYNVSGEVKEKQSLAIDIFDRLNVGKIGLTNAELIKALFMTSFSEKSDEEILRQQMQLGQEWDQIETTLNQPLFWNFICNNPSGYVTKIEYLFDIIQHKQPDDERNFTFNRYYEALCPVDDADKIRRRSSVKDLWGEVKNLYQQFVDWYSSKNYFHLIGFLVTTEEPIEDILALRFTEEDWSKLRDKSDFFSVLLKRAKDVAHSDILENENFYNKEDKQKIRNILLLFNILSIINSKDSTLEFTRFPFDKFREVDDKGRIIWDIEHIHSQNTKDINDKDRAEWIEAMVEYFTGADDYEEAKIYVGDKEIFKTVYNDTSTCDEVYNYCNLLVSFHESVPVDKRVDFQNLIDDLKIFFNEDDDDFKTHCLGNLTLLDKGTNRSYHNAFFPVKRMIMLRKAKTGQFIPLCTQNIFLKTYSKKFGNLTSWTNNDCEDYQSEIMRLIK